MKKFLLVILVISLVAVSIFAVACTKEEKIAEGEYTIVSPDGAPALALAAFAKDEKVSDTLTIKPSIVASSQIKFDAVKSDFAIVPANMAAILYNSGAEYKMVASVTNGNMYIVTNNADATFSYDNLKGKVLYTIGQGSIPAMILLATLKANNVEYEVSETPIAGKVAIQYCANGQALIAKFVAEKTAGNVVYGNLAEPAVTNMVAKGVGYKVADLQELWKTATSSEIKGYAQAVLIAKKSLCEEKPEVVNAVVKAIQDSEEYVANNAQEVRDNIATIYENTELPGTLTSAVVLGCNVKVHKAYENYDYIYNTLNAVYGINAQSVGGSVPAKDSGFYY